MINSFFVYVATILWQWINPRIEEFNPNFFAVYVCVRVCESVCVLCQKCSHCHVAGCTFHVWVFTLSRFLSNSFSRLLNTVTYIQCKGRTRSLACLIAYLTVCCCHCSIQFIYCIRMCIACMCAHS